MATLDVVMRIVHLLGAVLLAGGLAFAVLVLSPATRVLDDQFRRSLMQMVRRRFVPVIHAAAGALLLSGIYNWWRNVETYRLVKEQSVAAYGALQGLLGLKVLLAIVALVVLFMQGARREHDRPQRGWAITLAMTVVVIVLAAVVRHLRLTG